MSNSKSDIEKNLSIAANQGQITPGSQNIVITNLRATNLPATFGASPLNLGTTYPSLVKYLTDISGSVSGLIGEIADGLEQIRLRLIRESNRTGIEVLASETTFNDHVQTTRPFEELSKMKPFTARDYRPSGLTDLYGAVHHGLMDTIIYGADVYTTGATGYQQIMIILSDGQPEGHQSKSLSEVRDFIREFTSKPNAIVVLVGFGQESIFRATAAELGIVNVRVYNPNDPDWLDDMVLDISSSISHRSQKAALGQTQSGDFFVTN